jgi:hypothetical protein
MHGRSLAQQAVYLRMKAHVLVLSGLQLGARLFSVQIRDMSLSEVFLDGVLDSCVMLVGIQEPDCICTSAHVAALCELQHVVLQRLNHESSQKKRHNAPALPVFGAQQHPET